MTEPTRNPFAVPKPPSASPSGARTVKPSQLSPRPEDRAWKISIHWQSWKAVDKGTKTCNIVPANEGTWPMKVRVGHRMKMIARREPAKPPIPVEVLSVCHHAELGDIPSCEVGHDAERILPHAPTWLEVLQRAALGGTPGRATGSVDERGKDGWIVVEFRKATDAA